MSKQIRLLQSTDVSRFNVPLIGGATHFNSGRKPPRRPKRNKATKDRQRGEAKTRTRNRRNQRDQKLANVDPYEPHAGDGPGFLKRAVAGVANKVESSVKKVTETKQKIDQVTNLMQRLSYPGSDASDVFGNLQSRIEDLAALFITAGQATSISSFMGAIHLYARTHYVKSTSHLVYKMLDRWLRRNFPNILSSFTAFGEMLSPHAGFADIDLDFVEMIGALKGALHNWERIRHGKFGMMIGNLLTILATSGLAPSLDGQSVSFSGFELYEIRAWDVQKQGLDFIEMVFKTLVFFFERGHDALISGSFTRFITGDDEAITLDAEFAILMGAKDLIEAGHLEELDNSRVKGIQNLAEYDLRVSNLTEKCYSLMSYETNKIVRNTLSVRVNALTKLRASLIVAQKSSAMRIAPYGVLTYGSSAVGKSYITQLIAKTILSANGFASTKEHICNMNGDDKFQSDYKTLHTCLILDDMCNTRADRLLNNPTENIIAFLNNVPRAALKADVGSKGNVMIAPKLVVVTTNVKGLEAAIFSNEPASILRRFNVTITVALKTSHTDSEGKLSSEALEKDPDAWLITAERAVIVKQGDKRKDQIDYRPVIHNGQELKDVPLFLVLDWMKIDSAEHYRKQEKLLVSVEDVFSAPICEHGRVTQICPECFGKSHNWVPSPPIAGTGIPPQIRFGKVVRSYALPLEEIDETEGDVSLTPHSNEEDCEHAHIAAILSRSLYANDDDSFFNDSIDGIEDSDDDGISVVTMMRAEGLTRLQAMLRIAQERFDTLTIVSREFVRGSVLKAYKEKWHESLVRFVGPVGVIALTGYLGFTGLRRLFSVDNPSPQGELLSIPRPPELLSTDQPSVWTKYVSAPIPCSFQSRGITSALLCDYVARSIAHLWVNQLNGRRKVCCIVPLRRCYWLAPYHQFAGRTNVTIEVRTTPIGTIGKNFTQTVGPDDCFRIPDTDFVVLRLLSGGDVPDLSKFLLTGEYPAKNFEIALVGKDEEVSLISNSGRVSKIGDVEVKIRDEPEEKVKYRAYEYILDRGVTAEGQCMTAAITATRTPGIIGFHSAGRTGTPHGVIGCVTSRQVAYAIAELEKIGFSCHSSGPLVTNRFDIDFTPVPRVHPRHCVNFLPESEPANLLAFGSTPSGTVQFKSNVTKSVISDAVNMVMDLPRLHGPPNTECINKHWQRDLALMVKPTSTIDPVVLRRAIEDLKNLFKCKMSPRHRDMVHVYTNDVVLAGMDGIAAVGRLDLNTSVGFPRNKPKKHFIHESERKVLGISAPLDMDQSDWDAVSVAQEKLLAGERIYSVFRGNLKDEPTKFTKDKIRVFAGCDMTLTILVRRYFLSIARMIQELNFKVESAVGINAYGKAWGDMKRHFDKFPGDKFIAGDFKAFDKNVSPMFSMAAFEVMLDIARQCGYTNSDLLIMQGLATEICYPVMEYNGVLIALFGSNPSGHPLTVIVNNLINSLYQRYAFYSIYGSESPLQFADRVLSVNYGDDNLMKVLMAELLFTHAAMVHVLKSIGVVYTRADKSEEHTEWIPFSEVEFLKRTFRFEPAVNEWVAPIDISSISKSLHNYMDKAGSPVLPRDISAQALVSANNEFFRHGRDVFEFRRRQLIEVAAMSGIPSVIHLMPGWDQMVQNYLGLSPQLESSPNFYTIDFISDDSASDA